MRSGSAKLSECQFGGWPSDDGITLRLGAFNIEPDPDWIVRPEVVQGLQVLATRT